jgi:hypothetical protein
MRRRYDFDRFGYDGTIYETRKGLLVLFMGDVDRWKGPYPGKSWEEYIDSDMIKLRAPSPDAYKIPTFWIGPDTGYCRGPLIGGRAGEHHFLIMNSRYEEANKLVISPRCRHNLFDYKHCSKKCWYIAETITRLNEIRKLEGDVNDSGPEHAKMLRTAHLELVRFKHLFGNTEDKWKNYREKWSA